MPVGATIATAAKTAAVVGSAVRSQQDEQEKNRAEIKEQNQGGYRFGGDVSQTQARKRRTTRGGAAVQNSLSGSRALLWGGLALVVLVAVRK
jgi:hypothetical protein